jgi:hypothetical protein
MEFNNCWHVTNWLVNSSTCKNEFCYGVSGVPERYLEVPKFPLISAIDFYYVINKLIILVPDSH